MAWRVLAVAAVLVALCDAAQPLVLPWTPRLYGAVGGAVLYALVAAGAARRRRWAAWTALVVPLLPIGILAATAAGLALPVRPDAVMVGVLGLQLAAAAAAAATELTSGTAPPTTRRTDPS